MASQLRVPSATAARFSVRADARRRQARGRVSPAVVQLVVFTAALGARLAVVLRRGGLHGNFGYDAGVYFAAGDAFVHGRLPYRDFVLIHPPVVVIALSPFAVLTHVMSDESAFTTAVLACNVLGAVNAVLVTRVARHLGAGIRGEVVAGLFYALWFGAIGSEYLIKLEPIGNTLFLLALLAGVRATRDGPTRWPLLAGLALGATLSVKIWWIVPALVAVLWVFRRTRSRRQIGLTLAGVALVGLLIDGPFFLAAPHAMWSSVVTDQVQRRTIAPSPLTRLADLGTVSRLAGPLSPSARNLVGVVVIVALAWVACRAWPIRSVRPVVVLLGVQLTVLLAAPSWFSYYADFVAIPAAITVGAAAAAQPTSRPGLRSYVTAGSVVTAAAVGITVPALVDGRAAIRPFHGVAALRTATSHVPCVMSDSPMGQIQLNALTRSFGSGCRNWVDVTGRTYGPDRSPRPRHANEKWQRDLGAYLRSGQAVIIVRGRASGIAPGTLRAVARDGVLARSGGHTVYRVIP